MAEQIYCYKREILLARLKQATERWHREPDQASQRKLCKKPTGAELARPWTPSAQPLPDFHWDSPVDPLQETQPSVSHTMAQPLQTPWPPPGAELFAEGCVHPASQRPWCLPLLRTPDGGL